MEFMECIIYLTSLSIGCFILGRLLPRDWFRFDRFPFRSFSWEENGQIYNKLHIKHWQNHVPDMSELLPGIMPAKQLSHNSLARLPEMLQETCIAEFIHVLLCAAGFLCWRIWVGTGGRVVSILYMLGNLPYILIQRYNRPRLLHILRRQQQREGHLELCKS